MWMDRNCQVKCKQVYLFCSSAGRRSESHQGREQFPGLCIVMIGISRFDPNYVFVIFEDGSRCLLLMCVVYLLLVVRRLLW
jgi:hypothetical protein